MRVWSLLKFYTILVYAFMFAPILVVLALAFNASQFGGFPIEGLSLRWFYKLAENEAIMRAMRTSLALGFSSGEKFSNSILKPRKRDIASVSLVFR